MHTPDQAAELWCPMARIARVEVVPAQQEAVSRKAPEIPEHLVVVGGCNTDALGRMRVPASCRCIADKCGMWRWGEWVKASQPEVVDSPAHGVGGRRVTIAPAVIPVKGYCGLAGRPGAPA